MIKLRRSRLRSHFTIRDNNDTKRKKGGWIQTEEEIEQPRNTDTLATGERKVNQRKTRRKKKENVF